MRGIVLHAGQGLRDMYNERVPLYEQYADITIGCADEDFERVVSTIVDELKKYRPGHRPGR
jgi:shikimate kinase